MGIWNSDFSKACDELLLTTDMHKIDDAVYGSNKIAKIYVMENPLLTEAHLSHLLGEIDNPQDRVTILSHPNFPASVVNQLDLSRESELVCEAISNHAKANEWTKISARVSANQPVSIRF